MGVHAASLGTTWEKGRREGIWGEQSRELAAVLTALSARGPHASRGWTPTGSSRGLRCPCTQREGEPPRRGTRKEGAVPIVSSRWGQREEPPGVYDGP